MELKVYVLLGRDKLMDFYRVRSELMIISFFNSLDKAKEEKERMEKIGYCEDMKVVEWVVCG